MCVDGGKAALEAIAEGKINCSVECSPRLGPQAFDAVGTPCWRAKRSPKSRS